MIVYIILFVLVILLLLYRLSTIEHHDSGAIIQLVSKDSQDSYLIGNAWEYYPFYFYRY